MGCNSTKPAEAPISNRLKSQLEQNLVFPEKLESGNIRYYTEVERLNSMTDFWPFHAD